MVGDTALAAGAGLGLELVDEIDDVEEPPAGSATDAGAGDADGEVIVYRERKRFFLPYAALRRRLTLRPARTSGGTV
jgi:hypothetical protein